MESLLANSDEGRYRDSTMFDYLGNVMSHAPQYPPLDTEDKMNTQGSDFFSFPFFGSSHGQKGGLRVSLERSSVRACSGQKTFTTLCEKHCFMPSFFFYPSSKQLV